MGLTLLDEVFKTKTEQVSCADLEFPLGYGGGSGYMQVEG